ncbi:MAG: hypothetical protein KKB21_00370 [Nanoarchaeota archaeon]|nr:hypothetical protein [Nanoarchaeota archaeon]
MSLLGTIGEELHDAVRKIREYAERLELAPQQRNQLYETIRGNRTIPCPMPPSARQVIWA